jgi:predicted DNA-binding WGR domain protein
MILAYTGKTYSHENYSTYESNKFWTGRVEGSTVWTRWGRLGRKGQSKSYNKGDNYSAQAFLDKKIREKRGKGYREITEQEFDRLAIIGATVGTSNKVSLFEWVKRVEDRWVGASELELNNPNIEPGMKVVLHRHNGDQLTLCVAADGDVYEQPYRGVGRPGDWRPFEPTDKKLIELVDNIREAMGHWVTA